MASSAAVASVGASSGLSLSASRKSVRSASANAAALPFRSVSRRANAPARQARAVGAFSSEMHKSAKQVTEGFFGVNAVAKAAAAQGPKASRRPVRALVVCKTGNKTVVIGLAADSGCGKSTFMRRLTSVFGGAASPPKGGNPDSNTLISDTTTVICLDDYHSLDRNGRKREKVTALDPRAQNFDLMYEQVKALKEGKAVDKPIYNHVTGLLDPPERIESPDILVIEGLHPM